MGLRFSRQSPSQFTLGFPKMARVSVVTLSTASVVTLTMSCASVPDRERNPYEDASVIERLMYSEVSLPIESGTEFVITQGAFGHPSHQARGREYAWDFDVPFGTHIVSVQAGKVIDVEEPPQGGGCDPRFSAYAHKIKIEQTDGTVAEYTHLLSHVRVGEPVKRGQVIAVTALNGWICRPQLHFAIFKSKTQLEESPNCQTVPVLFKGLPSGIARVGTSGVSP